MFADDLPILDFVPGGQLSILLALIVWTVVVILATKWYVVRRATSDAGYLVDLAGKFARAKAKAAGVPSDLEALELRAKLAVANAVGAFELKADAALEALGRAEQKIRDEFKKD